MRPLTVLLTATLLLGSCGQDGIREVVRLTSPGGLPFALMEIDEAGVTDVTIAVAWPTDWPLTPGRNPAVPYVAAQFLPSVGTAALDPATLSERFTDMNADGSLTPGTGWVRGNVGFPRAHTDEVLTTVNAMLRQPATQDIWLARIRDGIADAQRQVLSDPATQMWIAQRIAVYGDGALVASVDLPDISRIAAVTLDDIDDWRTATLTRQGALIAVAGAISAGDAGRAVDMLFDGLADGAHKTRPEVVADWSPISVLLHVPSAVTTSIAVVGPLPNPDITGELDDVIATSMFGAQPGGPLFEAIRTDLRATYGFQTGFLDVAPDAPFVYITGEIAADKLADARDAILATYDDFRAGTDMTGFDTVHDALVAQLYENISYVDVSASILREALIEGGDTIDLVAGYGDLMAARTSQDVADRMSVAFPAADRLLVVAVSPDAGALPGACVIASAAEVVRCR